MRYMCNECGRIFDEEDFAIEVETLEYWGAPCEQSFTVCPYCAGGSFETAEECVICGAYKESDQVNHGVCLDCLKERGGKFETAYKMSLGETDTVKINALLAYLLEPSDIEGILLEHIRTRMPDIDCSEFVTEDAEWGCEQLLREVINNENAKIKPR